MKGRSIEAIISVDGGDTQTAAACGPFLVDPPFRMVSISSDWTGSATSTGFYSRICGSFSVTDSMMTQQRQSFSNFYCNPRIRNRTSRL
jgi:hypothetical protein